MKDKCQKLIALAGVRGLKFIITCTARSYKEQIALYAQGRQPIEEVNHLRQEAGMNPISKVENNYKVTWTLSSRHIVNPDDKDSTNDKSRAFDIAVLNEKGKPTWEIKTNVNKNDIPDYEEIGRLGESIGLRWGGRFKDKNGKPSPDYPHFEEPLKK
jgi:peptidoglycan L-alanyl-D-glutamate endopeptidase CwlK